jgi:uncharacterized protein (DUF2344 family)
VQTGEFTLTFKDGFEKHAKLIIEQAKSQGVITMSQLEYLQLYKQIIDDDLTELEKSLHDASII